MKSRKYIVSSSAAVIAFLLLSVGFASAAPFVNPLPSGWQELGRASDVQMGALSALEAHFQTHSDNLSPATMPLEQWAIMEKKIDAKDSGLTNSVETELKSKKIGEHETWVYEITGEAFGTPFHYQKFFLKAGDSYMEIMCWTTPANWNAAQPKFEELAASVH